MALFNLKHDDIFISYCRSDATTYTDGLANELTLKGFSCFTDALGTDANKDLPPTLISKLKGCRMLVVVGSADASRSGPVGREIELFAAARGSSAIIPLDFDGRIDQASWKDYITGIRREKEIAGALSSGNPSPAVVSRIEKAFSYRKSKDMLRLYTRSAIAILLLLIAAIAGAVIVANKQFKHAATATRSAEHQKQRAKEASALADKQIALAEQERKKVRLLIDSNLVISKKKAAAEAAYTLASQKAMAATALAEQQQKVARSLQYANESKAMLGTPDLIPQSVARATASMEISREAGSYSLIADDALRSSLAFLPEFKGSNTCVAQNLLFTPPGEVIEERSSDTLKQFYRQGESSPFFHSGATAILYNQAAVSAGGHYIASGGGQTLQVFNTSDGTYKEHNHVIKGDNWSIEKVAISPDGKYVAASMSGNDAGNLDCIVLWDTQRDSVIEIPKDINVNSISFSPNGSSLAIGGRGFDNRGRSAGTAYIWDMSWFGDGSFSKESFESPYTQFQDQEITGIAAGIDYTQFASSQGNNITVWKMGAHKKYMPVCYIPDTAGTGNFIFRPAQKEIAVMTGNEDRKTIATWSYAGYTAKDRWLASSNMDRIAFDGQGTGMLSLCRYATPEGSDRLQYWQHQEDKAVPQFSSGFQSQDIKYYTEDLQYIVTLKDSLHVWHEGQVLCTIPIDTGKALPEYITMTPDGSRLAWVQKDKNGQQEEIAVVRLVHDGYEPISHVPVETSIADLAFSPDGTTLFLRGAASSVTAIATDSKKQKAFLVRGQPVSGQSFRVSPKGNFICLYNQEYDNEINKRTLSMYVWNIKTGHLAASIEGITGNMPDEESYANNYAWSPDEKSILVNLGNQTGILATGKNNTLIRIDNPSSATTVSFSSSGKFFGIGQENGVVRILEAASRKEISRITTEGRITHLIFSPDDRYYSIATNNATMLDFNPEENFVISTWQLQPEGLMAEARQRLEKIARSQGRSAGE